MRLSGAIAAIASVTLAWGLALFVTDDGFSKDVWVWPGDPLASRLIAVMLFTAASASVYAIVRPATARMTLAVIATYGMAGALASTRHSCRRCSD